MSPADHSGDANRGHRNELRGPASRCTNRLPSRTFTRGGERRDGPRLQEDGYRDWGWDGDETTNLSKTSDKVSKTTRLPRMSFWGKLALFLLKSTPVSTSTAPASTVTPPTTPTSVLFRPHQHLYVYVILLLGPVKKLLDDLREKLIERFRMSDLGEVKLILGMDADYSRQGAPDSGYRPKALCRGHHRQIRHEG